MKDILTTLLAVLITLLTIILMIRGIEIGNFKVLSVAEIKENSEKLDNDIEELNILKDTIYRARLSNLDRSIKNLTINKQDYLDIASLSTDEEIKEANQEKVYAMEFLWNKVGNYATKQGVNLKWDVTSTGKDNIYTLSFSVTGSYIGILNYVYELENDSELAFTIENFKVVSGKDAETLNAIFTVSNIGIKKESITSSVPTTSTNDNK